MAETVHLYFRLQGVTTTLPFSSVEFYREGGLNTTTHFRPNPAGDGTTEHFRNRTGFNTRPLGTTVKFTLPRSAESARAIQSLRGSLGSQHPNSLALCNNENVTDLLRTRNATLAQVV